MAGTQSIRRRSDFNTDDEQECMPLIPRKSVQPSSKEEELKDFLSYISATILMFFLISIGIALALIPILTMSAGQYTNLMYRFVAVKIIRNVYSNLVSFTLIWFVRNKHKWFIQGYVWYPGKSRHLARGSSCNGNIAQSEHSSLFRPVLILGVLSAFMDVMSIIVDLHCLISQGVQPLKDTRVMDLLNDTVYLILVIAQLCFFYVYDGAVFAGRSFSHYAMALFIASNIWAWVGVTMAGPYWHHFGVRPEGNECNHTVNTVIDNLNSAKLSLGIVFPEYSTMAITIMYSYWSTMTSSPTIRKRKLSKDINNEIDFDNSHQSQIDQSADRSTLTKTECNDRNAQSHERTGQQRNVILLSLQKHYFITLFSFFTFLVFFALNIVTQYGNPKKWATENLENASIISGLISVAIIVTTTYLITLCYGRLESNYINDESQLGSSDYLLVFATTWCFLYDIIQIAASVDLIRSGCCKLSLGVVGLLLSICFSTETALQTRFFLIIQRVDISKVQSREFIRSCIIPIMIMNAGYWVITALAHEWADGGIFAPIISMSFDDHDDENSVKIGSIIILIIFPMVSLFRFHSTFICYEILKMIHYCEEPPFSSDESESTAEEVDI